MIEALKQATYDTKSPKPHLLGNKMNEMFEELGEMFVALGEELDFTNRDMQEEKRLGWTQRTPVLYYARQRSPVGKL